MAGRDLRGQHRCSDRTRRRHEREHSEETAREVDCAIRHIVESAFSRAVEVLETNRALLERAARLLLEKETLTEIELLQFKPAA